MREENLLLTAKLAPPALPPGLVRRPRLGELLTAGARGPVTVVTAPAGWGKTVLLSWWFGTVPAGRPLAWLSAEAADDGARFWCYLHAALRRASPARPGRDALPAPGPEPGPGPVTGPEPGEAYLARLAAALARLPEPVVLVLDDLHHVRDARVSVGLEFLLRHAADRLRLVIGTRVDPPLPLHRWRLSGGLTEVRAEQLAFSQAESAELLTRHGLALPATLLGELHARTEGWPAGLRFAALRGQRGPDQARAVAEIGGDDRGIADYLIDEVIDGQPVEIRELLRHTSILDQMSGDLVDALTGRTDGARLLADLERANLFVVPVDARPGVYRYHRIFAELLRAELRRHEPRRLAELHRRAARWHGEHGRAIAALRHALAGQDWPHAVDVLAGRWPEIAGCGGGGADSPALPPPTGAVRADPELALAYAADRLDLRARHDARDYLRLAESHRHLLADDRRDRFARLAAALRLAEARCGGDPVALRRAATHLLTVTRTATDATDGEAARAVALAALGAAQLATADPATAGATLGDGLAAAEHAGLACPRLACASRLALVDAVRGALRSAERRARAALELPPCPGPSGPAHLAPAYLALALVHLQWDRLDEAATSLEIATRDRDRAEHPVAVLAAITRALLTRAQGDLPGGYHALLAGRRAVADWDPPGYLAHWCSAVEADLSTARGDIDAARNLLAGLPAEGSAPVAAALARVHLAAGDPDAALRALPGWAGDGRIWLPVRLDAGLLEALAARRLGDARRATGAVERVLQLAEPEGYRVIFTRAGTPVRELLADHLDSGTAYWFMASELTASSDHRAAPEGLDEPLTERETTVLRYLQSILSTGEIAAELSLSVNTVKTHVRNIYRKLAVTRRRDAVRRARELHVL